MLDTFFRALPHTYREIEAENGTRIVLEIAGEAGGAWTLQREDKAWRLYEGEGPDERCRVRMDQDTAWRRATKGLSEDETARRVEISGQSELGAPVLRMLAVRIGCTEPQSLGGRCMILIEAVYATFYSIHRHFG